MNGRLHGLDLLRGASVVMVVLFHYGIFHAGWIGVQMFFALSGYLITSILLRDRDLPFLAYVRRFYWRRALRILPLYFAFLLVITAAWGSAGAPSSLPSDWPYLVSFTANFARARESDIGPVVCHLWSLSMEEQFYLFWPCLVYLLGTRTLKCLVAGILALAPLLRLWLFLAVQARGYPIDYAGRLAYVLPFTQFDAFAAGAAIALWQLERLHGARILLLAAVVIAVAGGLANAAVSHFYRGGVFIWALGYPMYLMEGYQYVWGYSLLNLVSALLIVCALQGVPKAVAWPLLERTGQTSYGVYVLHLPLLLLAEWSAPRLGVEWNVWSRTLFFPAYALVVLLFAEASFRWFETPFLNMKERWMPQLHLRRSALEASIAK